MQEEITYLREIRNKKNAIRQTKHLPLFERRYSGYGISRKTNSDQDTIPTKLTKTTDSWTNTDVWNKKAKHASEDGSSLTISQFHHPNKEIKSKRIKENQSREICDKTKELKNLDHNHNRNTVHKKFIAFLFWMVLIYIVCRMNLSK